MAAITGSTGSVSIKDTGTEIFLHANAWTLDWDIEMHDVTEFSSTVGYKDMTPGLGKATGTASGWFQDQAEAAFDFTDIITDGAAFILTASTGRTYTFTGNILSASFESEKGVPTPWSCTFEAVDNPVPA